jgi:hypothetical protein
MTSISLSQELTETPAAAAGTSVWWEMVRREWRNCRSGLIEFVALWLIGLWVLVIFSHPGWLLGIGLLHVLVHSPTQAGRDLIDGTEEFSFAQPPGRGPLYLARLVPGMAFLLFNGLVGCAAIAFDLPQQLWSLVFSSGLTDPFPPVMPRYWYAAAILLPCAAHAVTFAFAANAKSRGGVFGTALLGICAALLVWFGGFWLEFLLWGENNAILAAPALVVTTVLVLLAGYLAYCRKEATRGAGVAAQGNGSLAAIVIAIAIILILVVGFFAFRHTAVQGSQQEQRLRAQDAQREQAQRLQLEAQRAAERAGRNANQTPSLSPQPAQPNGH